MAKAGPSFAGKDKCGQPRPPPVAKLQAAILSLESPIAHLPEHPIVQGPDADLRRRAAAALTGNIAAAADFLTTPERPSLN
jgi:hypothetical protein